MGIAARPGRLQKHRQEGDQQGLYQKKKQLIAQKLRNLMPTSPFSNDLPLHLVALAAPGQQEVGHIDLLRLLAQAVDVDGERIVVDKFLRLPQILHDLRAREDPALVLHQQLEDAQLVLGQLGCFPAQETVASALLRRTPLCSRTLPRSV